VTIDTSGKWWKGSGPDDLDEYLRLIAPQEIGYPLHAFRSSRCACGSQEFRLCADLDEGGAERTCTGCGIAHLMCDSADVWDEAEPRRWRCVCKRDAGNVAVGFSLREDGNDVRWILIGVRCTSCGVLSTYGDWKIDYSPSLALLELA
jgi:hypothetical protein